ncbi:MAG: hypothetical protein JXO44_02945 [Clostridia bacterium]|nr:hypothetical protein [Clostridia bacterium]
MGSERAVLWSVCLVLMLFVVVTVVDYAVILHAKSDFDFYCQQFFWQCEENSGLTAEEKAHFISTLQTKGYQDVLLSAPTRGSMSKGQAYVFSVSADKTLSERSALFVTNHKKRTFSYEQHLTGRRVVN